MKKKILFLLLITSAVVLAQQKKYNIIWEGSQILSGGSFSVEVPSFNKENFTYSNSGLLFVDQWETKSPVGESSITLSNVSYQTLSKAGLKDLDTDKIPNKLEFSLENSIGRNKSYAFFQLSPIIKDDNGSYKKVISFQINYRNGVLASRKSSSSKNFRASAVVSNSVLSSGQWYRFYVEKSGVFILSKSFLQRLGVDVINVVPRSI